ncbi:serendipity locus protein alpha isoform X2 [Cylas formicarius]|uniref:serendipity locus protein alpha isoform X2 n=1 Tax=Cylas formicarius TaxID=197179 RepID=UPI002958BB03|nr:serendipity locus protein alpha isoform X2 [Cylas formicarius]
MNSNPISTEIKAKSKLLYDLLQDLNHVKEILPWFKDFCKYLSETIICIKEWCMEIPRESYSKNSLILYLLQLVAILANLINIFVKEFELKQQINSRNFIKKNLINCLDGIIDVLISQKSVVQSSNFITFMDSALDKIHSLPCSEDGHLVKNFFDCKSIFEDVLGHAMSIAQVALIEDSKIIRGSAQMVLEALDLLFREIHKHPLNKAMVQLYSNLCNDRLCSLERKINNTILKLALKVFLEYTDHIEAIATFCLNNSNRHNMEELDAKVVDFDLHVDRIIQIGLFAVSCCSNTYDGVKIQSCLASLEALETELVPAFTAVLKNPTNENLSHSFILKLNWLHQANKLKTYIFHVIDPYAFCKIVSIEANQYIEQISEAIRSESFSDINKLVQELIKVSNVLNMFISTTLERSDNNIEKIKPIFDNFLKVHHEVKSAKDILLKEPCRHPESFLRVLKRCKLLGNQMKAMYCFLEEESVPEKSNNSLQLPTLESNKQQKQSVGFPLIEHIINRGQQILQERSILYPSKINKVDGENMLQPNLFNSKCKSLRKMSFINVLVKKEASFDLQITDILNELTIIGSSFKE